MNEPSPAGCSEHVRGGGWRSGARCQYGRVTMAPMGRVPKLETDGLWQTVHSRTVCWTETEQPRGASARGGPPATDRFRDMAASCPFTSDKLGHVARRRPATDNCPDTPRRRASCRCPGYQGVPDQAPNPDMPLVGSWATVRARRATRRSRGGGRAASSRRSPTPEHGRSGRNRESRRCESR